MPKRNPTRGIVPKTVAIATTGLTALLLGGVAATQAQQMPRSPRLSPPPVPTAGTPQVRLPVPGETQEQRLQRLQQERPGSRVYDIAAETRGKLITIAGKPILLPPDAYVEAMVTHVTCGVGNPNPCPGTPAYTIRRGNSRIGVAINSGRINAETLASGEERIFDFLKTALRGA